jgi:hypothetical protein
MISKQEQMKRQKAMENALANQRLEGLEPDPQTIADSERWTRGEITIEEMIAIYIDRVRRGEIRG